MNSTFLCSLKRVLASIHMWILGTISTILLFVIMLLVTAVTLYADPKRTCQHALCFWWSDAVLGLNPYWNVQLHGLDHIDQTQPYVIVANHQSIADVAMLFQTRIQFKYIAKNSLFRIPFLGWCMTLAKHVRLRRNRLSSIRKAYQEASDWIDQEMSVMFFPEGTRSASGEMRTFHKGAFRMALQKNVPVLLVAIQGTGKAMPKGKSLFLPGGTVSLNVLPALDPDDFTTKGAEKMRNAAWERIHNALAPSRKS
ncbi:lysophospholipid acyltransferase family protein [Desulfoplanes sp.]